MAKKARLEREAQDTGIRMEYVTFKGNRKTKVIYRLRMERGYSTKNEIVNFIDPNGKRGGRWALIVGRKTNKKFIDGKGYIDMGD